MIASWYDNNNNIMCLKIYAELKYMALIILKVEGD